MSGRMSLRTVVASVFAVALACASHRIPTELRGYDVLVEGRDPQDNELARAFRAGGFHVRRTVRGGSGPTAAVVYFTFRSSEAPGPTWLHLRLADTRTGAILRAASIALDSVPATPRERARAAVRALMAQDTVFLAP